MSPLRLPPLARTVLPGLQAPARWTLILAAHALLLGWALQAVPRTPAVQQPEVMAMEVRTITPPKPLPQLAPPPPPVARRSAPTPPAPARQVPRPEPILAAAPSAAAAEFSTPPPSPAPVAAPAPAAVTEVAPAPEAPRAAAITPARFDADYLQNPAPAYPVLARRQGEQGRVLLLVRVSAAGGADEVQIKQTSGHPRLDEAALAAVRQWRFVPARQGSEAVAANVVVPITFRLNG